MCNTKTCNHCKQEKPLEEFNKNRNQPDGHDKRCRLCEKIFRAKYMAKEKVIPETKVCNCCGVEKTNDNFHKYKGSKDGLWNTCKQCRVPICREYASNNKERHKEYMIGWKIKNPTYDRDRHRKRRDSGEQFYILKSNIRNLIRGSFKRKHSKKARLTIQILGCSIQEFIKHIESQFLPWMSWDNMGNKCNPPDYNCSWDLDHIVPISCAKTDEDVYKLNHWSNFQPLCSRINRGEKSNNIPLVCNTFFKDSTENL